ncbi:hypothetical protein WKI65_33295 [Streptomyces sp. MS1.AVA.3]|uniref:hypothetical protein n=1 Tax=Streptomyces decoyicus TaxID=249567 RepID=UPI0030C41F2D
MGPKSPAGVELRAIGSRMRSTNVERDVLDELHSPYIGARAVDVFDRVANACWVACAARSWSFTGPYGSGKSTWRNLIDAILGHDESRRSEAESVLTEVSPALPRASRPP